jgi:hypothetical protein
VSKKPKFIDSFACQSRAHCGTCRLKVAGRAFRQNLSGGYELPNGDVLDFECPFGERWATESIPEKEPGMGEKMKNVTQAAGRVAAAKLKGKKVRVSREERHARLDICRGCEYFNSKAGTCKKCGCVMKFKSVLSTESCPIGKW